MVKKLEKALYPPPSDGKAAVFFAFAGNFSASAA